MVDFTEFFGRRRAPRIIETPRVEGTEYCVGCKTKLYHAHKRKHRGAFLNGPEVRALIVTSLDTEDTVGVVTRDVAANQTLRPVKAHLRNRKDATALKTLSDLIEEAETPYIAHFIEGNNYGDMHLYALMQSLLDTAADKVWSCGCDSADCKDEKYCKNIWVARTRMVNSPDAVVVQCTDSHWRRVA